MATLSLSARLDRTDSSTPWGFRMQGGRDYGSPLVITRVTPGSLAAKCGLQVGDTITKIGDSPCDSMLHKEAQQKILACGNSLELALLRGGSGPGLSRPTQHVSSPASTPAAPSYGTSYGTPPAAQPSTYSAPLSHAPVSQEMNYNAAPKPFTPGGGSVPVAVNKQYNSPIDMYSVNNVMDSLATQTAGVTIGQPEAVPPWKSQPAGPPHGGISASYKPAGHAPAKQAWQPSIPSGPRKMKVGRAGDATRVPQTAGRIPVCSACNIQIRGPFISALDKTWCPDHFVCANPECRMPLIDEGFVEEAGQLFCVRDYEQYFAPRCHKCGAAIIGEIVNAMKQTYHMNCFLCSQCHQPIGSGSFHNEDGKIYCQKDWAALFQTKCYGCQFPIEPGDRWVEALNQNWHSECFNCSTCQVNLEGQSFFAKGGKPYCRKHAGGPRF